MKRSGIKDGNKLVHGWPSTEPKNVRTVLKIKQKSFNTID